jgi:hypothetical protein
VHRVPAPGPACTSLGPPTASGSFLLDLVHRGVMHREHDVNRVCATGQVCTAEHSRPRERLTERSPRSIMPFLA